MENKRYSILGSFKDLINALVKKGSLDDGRVTDSKLTKREMDELKRIRAQGKEINSMEDLAKKYEAKVDTTKAVENARRKAKKPIIEKEKEIEE